MRRQHEAGGYKDMANLTIRADIYVQNIYIGTGSSLLQCVQR